MISYPTQMQPIKISKSTLCVVKHLSPNSCDGGTHPATQLTCTYGIRIKTDDFSQVQACRKTHTPFKPR